MEKFKCCFCGEKIMINDDEMVNCQQCGTTMTVGDHIEEAKLDMTESQFINEYREMISSEVTMSDVLEIVNSNIEFSKKYGKEAQEIDETDLPF